jgi:predicted flap endonuclease-1-like 5' DNA nuclease
MHRGLGQDRARELAALGIRTRAELAAWSPERLVAALRATGVRGPDRFLERRARVWLEGLEASKDHR